MDKLKISEIRIGDDLCITVSGGDKPHIGSTAIAVPRQSLLGNGRLSCTSSVINQSGHKDEAVIRKIAEEACCKYGCTVVCTGGIHIDGITKTQIDELLQMDLDSLKLYGESE